MLVVSDAWQAAYPDAVVGLLAMRNVANPARHPALDQRKDVLEEGLRARFGDVAPTELKTLPRLAAYASYYKRFKKTYHVAHQLASVAQQGKAMPRRAALVEAMFMAELERLLLTAGHDLATLVALPLRLDVATGEERYRLLAGAEQATKAGDMLIADGEGVVSSIVYGPDERTRIRPETRAAVFTVYGVPGIGEAAVREQLAAIEANVRLISPDAEVIEISINPVT